MKNRSSQILSSVLDAVGGTPCVRLNKVPKKHGLKCEVVAKLEFMNPGGSVKDRIGRQMVLDAEEKGILKKGSVLVEATSGNTGIGLSMAAAAKDYRMVITMPKKMSHEKEVTLNRLGAEVIRTETALAYDHPESLIGIAKRLRDEKGYVFLDQYYNESNFKAHFQTGQEIFDQCQGKVDMVVMTTGTGGTMTGVASQLKKLIPGVKIVGVDPYGSILADPDTPVEPTAYQVEGIGYDFVPGVCHRDLVDQWIKTRDQESFDLARELQRSEGLLVGGSCGSAMQGVIEAAKDLGEDKRVVVIFPDSIRNYMAKFADDNWMIEKGFMQGKIERPTYDSLKEEVESLRAQVEELKKKVK